MKGTFEKLDIGYITQKAEEAVRSHEIEKGKYDRYCRVTDENRARTRVDAYGCSDAANILYTLNRFPTDLEERKAFVETLQSFQDEKTGNFIEETHHVYHTTAHCIAALELFDALPKYPLTELETFLDISNFEKSMEDVDWLSHGCAAHAGAGIYAALVNAKEADQHWRRQYFDFFNKNCNPETGVWAENPQESFPLNIRIGDAFHYLFNYGHAYEPIPYPEQLIDTCLEAYHSGAMGESFGKQFHFIEMDWVYCLARASRQTPHRFYDIKETLYEFAKGYITFLNQVDWEKDGGANEIHMVFGVICCLAELQSALPGVISSPLPLRLTLDRRPFI